MRRATFALIGGAGAVVSYSAAPNSDAVGSKNRRPTMADAYHVNIHAVLHRPIFIDEQYAAALDGLLSEIVELHHICELARGIMPTHAHFVFVAFPDQSRPPIVQLLKG